MSTPTGALPISHVVWEGFRRNRPMRFPPLKTSKHGSAISSEGSGIGSIFWCLASMSFLIRSASAFLRKSASAFFFSSSASCFLRSKRACRSLSASSCLATSLSACSFFSRSFAILNSNAASLRAISTRCFQSAIFSASIRCRSSSSSSNLLRSASSASFRLRSSSSFRFRSASASSRSRRSSVSFQFWSSSLETSSLSSSESSFLSSGVSLNRARLAARWCRTISCRAASAASASSASCRNRSAFSVGSSNSSTSKARPPSSAGFRLGPAGRLDVSLAAVLPGCSTCVRLVAG
mmetsp:Transcript_23998/g.55643  ORF Transcript_23998/g.55643 Transcript_23998/m.55643 type:complete len:294 (-) Transcript_23998:152-1033(-)